MEKNFKVIVDYPNYEISDDGTVRNIKTRRIRKDQPHSRGKYRVINLSHKGKSTKMLIHRLVAKTYIPNPNNYTDVDHIDRNESNNNVSNLRWSSHYDNLGNRRFFKDKISLIYCNVSNTFTIRDKNKDSFYDNINEAILAFTKLI